MKPKYTFTINPEAPELRKSYKPPKTDNEYPLPKGFHWSIPQWYIDEGRHLEIVTFVHPKTGKLIQLDPDEQEEWHLIYTWMYHFGKNNFYPDLYKIQKDMLAFFIRYRFIVLEVFRGAGKSVFAEYLCAFFILENPRNILFLVGEEQKKTITRVMNVRNIVGENPIIAKYGYLIAQSNRKKKAADKSASFVCIRDTNRHEPTLKAMSWRDQQSQGDHYDGGIFDDVWSIPLQNEKNAKPRFLEWYGSFERTLGMCGWFIMLRTRKGVSDLYYELDKKHRWTKFTTRLLFKWPDPKSYKIKVDEETDRYYIEIKNIRQFYDHRLYGEDPEEIQREIDTLSDDQLWDKVYSRGVCISKIELKNTKFFEKNIQAYIKKNLDRFTELLPNKYGEMEKMLVFPKYSIFQCLIENNDDPIVFAREMQNQPFNPKGKVFKWENAHLFDRNNADEDPLIDQFYKQFDTIPKIMIMDPAKGQSEQADYNVLLVMAFYRARFWVIKGWVGRWDVPARKQVMKQAATMFPGVPMYIEGDFGQLSHIKQLVGTIAGLKLKKFISRGKGSKYQDLYKNKGFGERAPKLGKIHAAMYVKWPFDLIYLSRNLMMFDHPEGIKQQIISFPNCEKIDYLDALAMGILILEKKKRKTSSGRNPSGRIAAF